MYVHCTIECGVDVLFTFEHRFTDLEFLKQDIFCGKQDIFRAKQDIFLTKRIQIMATNVVKTVKMTSRTKIDPVTSAVSVSF